MRVRISARPSKRAKRILFTSIGANSRIIRQIKRSSWIVRRVLTGSLSMAMYMHFSKWTCLVESDVM